MKSIITFEDRLKQINSVDDIQTQLNHAKTYMMRLRSSAKQPNITLAQKIERQRLAKSAEQVLMDFRHRCFDLEDHVKAGGWASDFITPSKSQN